MGGVGEGYKGMSGFTWVCANEYAEPPPRQGGGKVEDVDGMIAKLKELGAI